MPSLLGPGPGGARLTAAAEAAAALGAELGFHNHDAEATLRDDGAKFLDELLAEDDCSSSSSTSAGPGTRAWILTLLDRAARPRARSCT